MLLEFTNLRHGAIIDRNAGEENDDRITLQAEGVCDGHGAVTVNGVAAKRRGPVFSAPVELTGNFNTVTVRAEDHTAAEPKIKVVGTRNPSPATIFSSTTTASFDRSGQGAAAIASTTFILSFSVTCTLNTGRSSPSTSFWRNDHDPDGFTLRDFPTAYRPEFSNQLRLAEDVVSRQERIPDRTYQNASAERLGADYDQVRSAIERFAGAESFIAMEDLHWAMARPDAFKALTDRGVRVLEGQFISPRTGISDAGDSEPVCDIGYFRNSTTRLSGNRRAVCTTSGTSDLSARQLHLHLAPPDPIVRPCWKPPSASASA